MFRGLVFILLATAQVASAEDAPKPADAPKPPPQEWKFALHGFLGGSLYVADGFQAPSPGQQTLWAAGSPGTDKIMLGGDIRQNRLNFSIAGPSVLGGTPRGVAEIDFFGGNSSGGYGDVSVFPRARVMYAELGWPNTTLRVGQEYSLIAGINTLTGPATSGAMAFPTSVGHVAFPVSYGAGAIGWRFPGIFLYHRIPMGENKMEIALEVARAGWANPANPGAGTTNTTTGATSIPYFTTGTDLGSASGLPQVEGRITYAMGTMLGLVLTGHYSQIDPSGYGVGPTGVCGYAGSTPPGTAAGCDTQTSYAVGFNFRVNLAPVIFQGGGFTGQNNSMMLGNIVQFPNLGAPTVSEFGGWAQAGFMFTKALGLYVFAGTEKPDYDAAKAAGMNNLQNTTTQAMLRYFDGGFAYGLEWTHWHTRTAKAPAAPSTAETAIDVNQVMFSTYYFF